MQWDETLDRQWEALCHKQYYVIIWITQQVVPTEIVEINELYLVNLYDNLRNQVILHVS